MKETPFDTLTEDIHVLIKKPWEHLHVSIQDTPQTGTNSIALLALFCGWNWNKNILIIDENVIVNCQNQPTSCHLIVEKVLLKFHIADDEPCSEM